MHCGWNQSSHASHCTMYVSGLYGSSHTQYLRPHVLPSMFDVRNVYHYLDLCADATTFLRRQQTGDKGSFEAWVSNELAVAVNGECTGTHTGTRSGRNSCVDGCAAHRRSQCLLRRVPLQPRVALKRPHACGMAAHLVCEAREVVGQLHLLQGLVKDTRPRQGRMALGAAGGC